jgi:hypothetical protein
MCIVHTLRDTHHTLTVMPNLNMKQENSIHVDFFLRLLKQCPDNSLISLSCNWTSVNFSGEELIEINKINKVENCVTDRQIEVFKSNLLNKYKYSEKEFGKLIIEIGNLNLIINKSIINELTSIIRNNFNDRDICHCIIYFEDRKIAKCYDNFTGTWLESTFFKFTKVEIETYAEKDIFIDEI